LKLGLVVADFNSEVTAPMSERARHQAEALGATITHLVHVPGVFDMPAVIRKLLGRDDVDAVVLIGAVIKGDTLHDEVIMHAVAGVAARMAGESGKPVALAITGPGMTDEQAAARIDYAARAVEAAVKTLRVLNELDAG
jgi:6,7-dimethyl-8-ribityllumazine synthase